MTRKEDFSDIRSHVLSVDHHLASIRDRVKLALEKQEKMDRDTYLELLEKASRLSSVVGHLNFSIRQAYIDYNPELFEGKDRNNLF